MKRRWGASAQSLLYHLHNLKLVDDDKFERFQKTIYHKGWRKQEPFDDEIMQEKPNLIKDAIDMLIENRVKTARDIVEDLSFPAKDIAALCGVKLSFFSNSEIVKPKLSLIR